MKPAGRASPQPRQCGGQAIGLGFLRRMVGTCLFDRFGLGAFDERRVVEASRETVAFLDCCGERLGQAVAFGGDVDHAFERDGDRLALDDELRRCARGGGVEADRFETREAIKLG